RASQCLALAVAAVGVAVVVAIVTHAASKSLRRGRSAPRLRSTTHWRQALESVRNLLNEGVLQDGNPKFRNTTQFDQFMRSRSFRLMKNEPFGPNVPNARQLIYQGRDNILIKIKTRGYEAGPRASRATMSIEVTDGSGTGWENALFKVDA